METTPLITVPDEGAVDVIREILAEHGIDVEVRRLEVTPYTPSVTGPLLQVRVPEGALARATTILDSYNEDLAREAETQAGAGAQHSAAATTTTPPDLRRRRERPLFFVVATTLVPLPVGVLALGFRWLATALFAIFAAGAYLIVTSDNSGGYFVITSVLPITGEAQGWLFCFAAKLADVITTAIVLFGLRRGTRSPDGESEDARLN